MAQQTSPTFFFFTVLQKRTAVYTTLANAVYTHVIISLSISYKFITFTNENYRN